MAVNYPTSLDTFTDPTSSDKLNSPSHSTQHTDHNTAVEELEKKVGTGASPASGASNGQVLVADGSGGTAWGNGSYTVVRKTTNETVNNSITGQADDELTFPVDANGVYIATFVVVYEATTGADLRAAVTAPTGAAGKVAHDALANTATASDATVLRGVDTTFGNDRGWGGAGAGVLVVGRIEVVLRNGANAGNVTFRWAQRVAEASDAIVHADSYVKYRKLA